MNGIAAATLSSTLSNVLSEMCFADPERVPPGPIENALCVGIRFTGASGGNLRLAISAGTAKQLAADFLGLEAVDATEEVAQSFSLELANILCGSILASTGERLHLALPSAESIRQDEVHPFCWTVSGAGPEIALGLTFESSRG